MNSPMSANAAMLGKRSLTWPSLRPRIEALMNTFSRPVNSELKPEPNSNSAATRPKISTVPEVGVSLAAANIERDIAERVKVPVALFLRGRKAFPEGRNQMLRRMQADRL